MRIPETDWDEWKGVLMTLKDEVFFDLMRSYLGTLQSPFNKHNLVRELFNLGKRPDFIEKVAGALDSEDLVILSAVAFLESPREEDLTQFLSGSFAWLALHQRLLNLEERLLLFRRVQDKRRPLRLSPLFQAPALGDLLSLRVLFPLAPGITRPTGNPWLDDAHLLAAGAFLREFPQPFNTNGTMKKKAATEWEARFPRWTQDGGVARVWDLTQLVFFRLGLAWRQGDEVIQDATAWRALADLEPLDRRYLLWAAAAGPSPEAWRTGWKALPRFLESLPAQEALSEASLHRWATRFPGLEGDWFPGLRDLGVLVQAQEGFYQRHPQALEMPAPPGPLGVLPPNFELTLKPGVTLAQGLLVSQFCRLKLQDTFTHFEITKAAAAQGFAQGLGAQDLVQALEDLTGSPLSQNLKFSLDQWQEESQAFRLFRGTLLVAAPQRAYTLEHSPGFSEVVLQTLAPGVYLLDPEKLEAWRKDLSKQNLAHLPPVQEPHSASPMGIPFLFPLDPPAPPADLRFPQVSGADPEPRTYRIPPELKAALDAGDFTPEERSELQDRIRRRVLLTPAQVTKAAARSERLEAGPMDYLGKIRLAEQALHATGDLLELVQRGPSGHPEKHILRPTKVERQGQEVILSGDDLETGVTHRLFLSRISHLKRIRSSLFG